MEKSNIDALVKTLSEIRFKLVIKKMAGPTISRDDLKTIVSSATTNSDAKVRDEIDQVFDIYFYPSQKTVASDADLNSKEGNILSLNGMIKRDAA